MSQVEFPPKKLIEEPDIEAEKPKSPERLPDMNNFYHYFPDGMFRDNFGKEGFEKQTEIMKAIDDVIAGEFKGQGFDDVVLRLNAVRSETARLLNIAIARAQDALQFKAKVPKNEAENRLRLDALMSEFKEINETLRPVFNKLLEMGFTESELAHGQ